MKGGFDLEAFREREWQRAMAQAQAEQREYQAKVERADALRRPKAVAHG